MPMNARLLRPRANRVSTPLPLTIAGLETWFDAADTGSVTLDSGRVSEWRDKSGKGRHAVNTTSGTTQPSYTANSLNGLHRVVFAAASQQFLVAGGIGDWNFLHNGTRLTAYAIVTMAGSRGLMSTIGALDSLNVGFCLEFRSDLRLRTLIANGSEFVASCNFNSGIFSGTRLIQVRTNLATSTPGRVTMSAGSDVQDAIEQSRTASASTSDSAYALNIGRYPGGTGHYTGSIAEMIFYSRDLSSAERLAIRNYLYAKWGLTGT